MKTNKLLLSALLLGTSLTLPATASVNVQLFNPAIGSRYTLTDDALIDGYSRTWNMGATYNMVNRPLVETTHDRKERLRDIIENINTINMSGGYYLQKRIFIGADIPVNLVSTPGSVQQFAIGDSKLIGKFRLTRDKAPVSFALIPSATFGTGSRSLHLSDGYGGGLKMAAERKFGRVRVAANVGYRHVTDGKFRDINFRNRLTGTLGMNIKLARAWSVSTEGTGTIVLPRNPEQNPGEVYAGGRFEPRPGLAFTAGASVGSVNGVGSTDYRVVGGIQFHAIPAKKPRPVVRISAVKKPKKRVFFERKRIRVTEEVKFEHAKARLTRSGQQLLDEVASVIKKNLSTVKTITIEGHTNRLGSAAYNLSLSKRRAASVKEYLTSRGIPKKILRTVGFGKTRPKVIKGLSRKAMLDANRRVEFKVTHKKKKKARKATKAKKAKGIQGPKSAKASSKTKNS